MEHKSRCSNAQYLIDYFINFGIPESQLLTGVNKTKSFISNPHNWLPIDDWHQIMRNCQKSSPHLTLDYWQKIACSIKDNETTGIWKVIAKFGGIEPLYRLTTRYIKSFNTFIDLDINSINKNSVDLLIISDPKVCSLLMVRWTTGVLQAIPCALDIPPAETQILLDQSDLKSIIIDFYKHYNLEYKDENGIIYVNDKPLGKHIKLKQEIENGKQLFTNKYSNEKPYNAILITHDLIINDTHLLKKGDIFNAPYGRVFLTWSKVSKKFSFSRSPKLKEELLISFNNQLALAEERYFELERLRKKEQEQIIQLKKALDNYKKIGKAIEIDWGKRYQDRNKFEKEMFAFMIKTIEPNINKLNNSGLNAFQTGLVDKLRRKIKDVLFPLLVDKLNRKVKDILLPMSEQIRVKDYNFTYSEFQIVKLIQEGRRSKEICDTLNISLRTVETHRMNIRKKLNISNKKTNLSSYLLSIK